MKQIVIKLLGASALMIFSQNLFAEIKPGFQPYKFQTELKEIIEHDIPEVSKQAYDRIIQDEFIEIEKSAKKTDDFFDVLQTLGSDLNSVPANKDAISSLLSWKKEHEMYLEKIDAAFDRYTCLFPSALEAVGKNSYVASNDFMRAMIVALGVETNQAINHKESLTTKQIQHWEMLSEIVSKNYQCHGALINNIIASSWYNQFFQVYFQLSSYLPKELAVKIANHSDPIVTFEKINKSMLEMEQYATFVGLDYLQDLYTKDPNSRAIKEWNEVFEILQVRKFSLYSYVNLQDFTTKIKQYYQEIAEFKIANAKQLKNLEEQGLAKSKYLDYKYNDLELLQAEIKKFIETNSKSNNTNDYRKKLAKLMENYIYLNVVTKIEKSFFSVQFDNERLGVSLNAMRVSRFVQAEKRQPNASELQKILIPSIIKNAKYTLSKNNELIYRTGNPDLDRKIKLIY